MSKQLQMLTMTVIVYLACGAVTLAQTTAFTYQGKLTDGGTPANGNYDLQFTLWSSLTGGTLVHSQTLNNVPVSNGVFTVSLDFGASSFGGPNRFLEIGAKPAGTSTFTLLSPRQQITSTPYSVRSLNATSADSVPASGVPAGSGNYIQNSTTPQTSSNFNISGNGTAGGTLTGSVMNAATQFNLGGNRVLSVGDQTLQNVFLGIKAGLANSTGRLNSFFGTEAGFQNTLGDGNSFFGGQAGLNNTSGDGNSFFGVQAGRHTTTAIANSFFGADAGRDNTLGEFNTFVGYNAGNNNEIGSFNTVVGIEADLATVGLSNATAIGAHALVSQSNSLVLGSISGVNGATANTKVGIGTTSPTGNLHVNVLSSPDPINALTVDVQSFQTGSNAIASHFFRVLDVGSGIAPAFLIRGDGNVGIGVSSPAFKLELIDLSNRGLRVQTDADGGTVASFGGKGAFEIDAPGIPGGRFTVRENGRVGIGTTSPDQPLSVNGNASKAGGGSWLAFSDERLKKIKGRFTPGLKAVMQLEPLRYEYKPDNDMALKSEGEHVGFSAQAVQKIIPEAVTKNSKGFLMMNNDPIMWTMVNAIKEQQEEIEALRTANARLMERLQAIEKTLKKSSARRR